MALIDLIQSEIVRVPLFARIKSEVFAELIQVLVDEHKVSDFDAVHEAILSRETLGSTGLANGIAVPHAKTDAVGSLAMAIGVSPAGIEFDALDGQPSRLFFLMVAPPAQAGQYVGVLAEIARITRSDAFCKALIASGSAQEVVDLFQEE